MQVSLKLVKLIIAGIDVNFGSDASKGNFRQPFGN